MLVRVVSIPIGYKSRFAHLCCLQEWPVHDDVYSHAVYSHAV